LSPRGVAASGSRSRTEQVQQGLGQELLGGGPGFGWEAWRGPVLWVWGFQLQAIGSVNDRAARCAQDGGGRGGAQDRVVCPEGFIPGRGPESPGHLLIPGSVRKVSQVIRPGDLQPQSGGRSVPDPGLDRVRSIGLLGPLSRIESSWTKKKEYFTCPDGCRTLRVGIGSHVRCSFRPEGRRPSSSDRSPVSLHVVVRQRDLAARSVLRRRRIRSSVEWADRLRIWPRGSACGSDPEGQYWVRAVLDQWVRRYRDGDEWQAVALLCPRRVSPMAGREE